MLEKRIVRDEAAPRPAAAFVFDLDGVLVDTVAEHRRAWRSIAAEIGSWAPDSIFEDFRGLSREACLAAILRHSPPTTPAQAVRLLAQKNDLFLAAIRRRGRDLLVPGVDAMLLGLKERGFRLAIASASRNAKEILDITAIAHLFEVVSDGNFDGRPKPAPDQLEAVSAALGVPPSRMTLIEDAERGAAAGAAAGLNVVGVGPRLKHWPGLMTWTESLCELDARALLELVHGDKA